MLLWQSSSYLLSLLEAKEKGELQYTNKRRAILYLTQSDYFEIKLLCWDGR